ncbi:secreted protein [Cryptosporidium xiaoi]|uniref:Secreted protein n=1 Tax=Cryptosporidium xiaoi TaxID=659607 RepID=A0AAV9XW09_9CRYT
MGKIKEKKFKSLKNRKILLSPLLIINGIIIIIIITLTSIEKCRYLLSIHSQIPISNEYAWGNVKVSFFESKGIPSPKSYSSETENSNSNTSGTMESGSGESENIKYSTSVPTISSSLTSLSGLPKPSLPLPEAADYGYDGQVSGSSSQGYQKSELPLHEISSMKFESLSSPDNKQEEDYVSSLMKINMIYNVKENKFEKDEQNMAYGFGGKDGTKDPKNYLIKQFIPQDGITKRPPLELIPSDEKKHETEDRKEEESAVEDVEFIPLQIGPKIPGTETGLEGLSHKISLDRAPRSPQKRQEEWDCIVSQIERDKVGWKVERGRMRYNYIPGFSDVDPSLFPLCGDAKTLYQNCVLSLKQLEDKSIITPPSGDETEANFLRATFCISASVYCYAESAIGDPDLQLYWNREVRSITDLLVSKDPNLELLQIVGESLSKQSSPKSFGGQKGMLGKLPKFLPNKLPNHSFAFASTKLEVCPKAGIAGRSDTDFEYEGGIDAILATRVHSIVVDDSEIWTMWRAIVTQKERDLNMNLKRFKVFSNSFPLKFNSAVKPTKLSELRNVCIELIRDGMNETPPRYELLPLAKPNTEKVLYEFCDYAADFYFGNRQWEVIYQKSMFWSNMVEGLPEPRPYSPFRYYAGETFNDMRKNCCSVIFDLIQSKVFPYLSTGHFRYKSNNFDGSKLEKFCHMAANAYFKRAEDPNDQTNIKNTGYFDFTPNKSKVTNYKTSPHLSLVYEGMQDLENIPGQFSVGSIDGSYSYTPRFPNLKPSLVCWVQWRAILDQNREDLNKNIETPTHLPEELPKEWNMPQFSRSTFIIACFRIIRKLYGVGSVSFRSKSLNSNENVDDKSEKILSDFCKAASRRYFEGIFDEYSLENQLKIQTDSDSQWNAIVEVIMRQGEKQKNNNIFWVYPVHPSNFERSNTRFNVYGDKEDDKDVIKELGFESRCLEGLRTYYSTPENELPKMEVNTEDDSLIDLEFRKVCKEAGDYFFGAIEWIRMYRASTNMNDAFGNLQQDLNTAPIVTGLPRKRPIKPLKYKGAGRITLFRDYCFAYIWNLWRSGNENNLRISGKLFSSNMTDKEDKKALLEHWCTSVANEAYNINYKLSIEEKKRLGITDLHPRMDPQTSLSVVESEDERENGELHEPEFGERIHFSFGDATSQWNMILSQLEVDKRRSIKRIIWLPEYPEIKNIFPGPVERRDFVRACVKIIDKLNEKSLVEWGIVSPEYQGVVMREFCSDAFYNGYELSEDRRNVISAKSSEREVNRGLLIEFLKYMHVNQMDVRKWVLFYLNENINLNYAISWALNEDNWSFLESYFHQSQLNEPENFENLFEEVRERVRQMGGFLSPGEESGFFSDANSSLAREKLWKAIYNQMYMDILMGRQQRIVNLPLKPPDFWLGSKNEDEFPLDCERVITRLLSQSGEENKGWDTNSEKREVKSLKDILLATRLISNQDQTDKDIIKSYCEDVLLEISNKRGYSIFKGTGFSYPGSILEFERNRQWNIISNLGKYSKYQLRDSTGGIGAISKIDNIPGFVRYTLFRGSYDPEEFVTQCEIALEFLYSDPSIPTHKRITFPGSIEDNDIMKKGEESDNKKKIISEYCEIASTYVFQENPEDELLDEDSLEEVSIMNDLDTVSRKFRLKNPLGLDYNKRWNHIIELAKKRISEEKYLRMNRVMKIDSNWLKNTYPKIAGEDLKRAFNSKENNHLASFVLVSYELFSAIMMGKEGLSEGSNKDKFEFFSRNSLLQFCRDVCYKYFTDEAKGDVEYDNDNKSATENALIYDLIATRPRMGPNPKDPLYELYPEQGEEVPELNSFNMDQYITSKWEIINKNIGESDSIRESLRKEIMDDLFAAETNLINFQDDGKNKNILWAPAKEYPWKHHDIRKANDMESILNKLHPLNKDKDMVLSGDTLKHMKAIFGDNIADIAKTTIIPEIPTVKPDREKIMEKRTLGNANLSEDDLHFGERLLPLGNFGEGAQVKRINVGGKSATTPKGSSITKSTSFSGLSPGEFDRFKKANEDFKSLVEGKVINIGRSADTIEESVSTSLPEEAYIRKGMKPRDKTEKKGAKKRPVLFNYKNEEKEESSLKSGKESEIDKYEDDKLADREWTVISQLIKLVSESEGGKFVVNIPIERPRKLYPKAMGNMRGMSEGCIRVLLNSRYRSETGARIVGKTREERKMNATIYCRKAAEVFYESTTRGGLGGEFVPPKEFIGLPGFQSSIRYIGGSKATRGRGNKVFIGESSSNPLGKEMGLRPINKESARLRKAVGGVRGAFGVKANMDYNPFTGKGGISSPQLQGDQISGAGFSVKVKSSLFKRKFAETPGYMGYPGTKGITEIGILHPGDDMVAEPDYYYEERGGKDEDPVPYSSLNKYVNMKPHSGPGSGDPKIGEPPKLNKDGIPIIKHIPTTFDDKEELNIKKQVLNRVSSYSKEQGSLLGGVAYNSKEFTGKHTGRGRYLERKDRKEERKKERKAERSSSNSSGDKNRMKKQN